jgi:hypothetical protein
MFFSAALSAFFCAYGVKALATAFQAGPLGEWLDLALPGAGGVILGVLFGMRSLQLIS